jgi:predicted ATPase
LARIMPESSEEDDGATMLPSERVRFHLIDRISSFFLTAAHRRPLLIVIDDLHWGDDGTLDVARLVADQIHSSPVVLILTHRDHDLEAGGPLANAVAELPADAIRLRLEGLDEVCTARIVADVTGVAPADDAASTIQRQTAGNPFFVREVSKLLVSQGRVDDLASGRSLPVPAAVRDVLERRFARLSQGASEVLGAASVLGISFDPGLVAAVGGASPDHVGELLQEAVLARILMPDETPGRYWFVHALMRQALYDGLSPAVKRSYHLKAAESLESGGAHPAEILHHFVGALPDASVSRVVSFAESAGKLASAMAAPSELRARRRESREGMASLPNMSLNSPENSSPGNIWQGPWAAHRGRNPGFR